MMARNSHSEKWLFRQLFDQQSNTYTYLIADPENKVALLVDPVLEQVDRDLKLLHELGLMLQFCLETHIHADHITGTDHYGRKQGVRVSCQSMLMSPVLIIIYKMGKH